jgi:flagellar FliJ protein
MKPFRFQYQKILDVRGKEVDTAKATYNKAVQDLEDARIIYDNYKNEEDQLQEKIASGTFLTTDELRANYQYLVELRKKREQQLLNVKEFEKFMFIRHNELIQAHKEEKKWDKLSQFKKETYISEQTKLEQMELDEISLKKYIMKNN